MAKVVKPQVSVDLSDAQTDATAEKTKAEMAEAKEAQSKGETVDEAPAEEAQSDSQVSMTNEKGEVAATSANAKKGQVRIKLLHAHSCVIGGERYSFEKGKVYNVPPDVKRILANAGLLTAL